MRHKLTTFILKNPPDSGDGGSKGKKKGESTGGDEEDSPDESNVSRSLARTPSRSYCVGFQL